MNEEKVIKHLIRLRKSFTDVRTGETYHEHLARYVASKFKIFDESGNVPSRIFELAKRVSKKL